MYEAVIGLEVHVQLKTASKLFCGCSVDFGALPNSQVCPICLGLPGSLPALNQKAMEFAVKVALALNCQVAESIKFDRKNYFYPDLPKNYQISQYDEPIGENGYLEIEQDAPGAKRIGIRRVHLEEDAGKLIHTDRESLVDFNRGGIPLLEIVTDPDINSPAQAYAYLTNLKQVIQYLGVSSCDMEKGILRCDANISIREKGKTTLGTKTEIKNMNSFRGVRDALDFEIKRQIGLSERGIKIAQETRLWDAQNAKSDAMRAKEEASDYRYFPEPDLPRFIIDSELRKNLSNSLPELPQAKKQRFLRDYKLSEYNIAILTSENGLADFFEGCFKSYPDATSAANWICGPLLSEINERKLTIKELNIKPEGLAGLIRMFKEGKISNIAAKGILGDMLDTGSSPEAIIKQKNLTQISDAAALDEVIEEALQENQDSVSDYLSGKENAVQYLVGQVMRKSKGKANPKAVSEILKKRLKSN